jgi:hypothetical protein
MGFAVAQPILYFDSFGNVRTLDILAAKIRIMAALPQFLIRESNKEREMIGGRIKGIVPRCRIFLKSHLVAN